MPLVVVAWPALVGISVGGKDAWDVVFLCMNEPAVHATWPGWTALEGFIEGQDSLRDVKGLRNVSGSEKARWEARS